MKKHAIIPIFIPHRGCPNDCVFCNQKAITARSSDVSPEDVRNTIETYLPTLTGAALRPSSWPFSAAAFTELSIAGAVGFPGSCQRIQRRRLIDKIHMSTRPDYIDRDILDNLKTYDGDIIELGVQSFDPDVLRASNRGHTVEDVYSACRLIKEYGFTLGIQLMIGLPGDSPAKSIASAKETVRLAPQLARLYPTIVLQDTRLLQMYEEGIYQPLTTEEAVSTTKEMYRILSGAGITILRVGLKSTDLITEGEAVCGHTFHPAFRRW